MQIEKTELEGVLIISPKIFGDDRGWFVETYSKQLFETVGIKTDFIQDNHSYSAHKNTLRGLHFQNNPYAQSKLVRCTRGAILDVAVDMRKNSPSYLKWVSVRLDESNKKQLFIPKGFAHGFLTLTDDVETQYKVDAFYSPELDRSVKFDDPSIGVEWGDDPFILSKKDENAPFVKDSDCNFTIDNC